LTIKQFPSAPGALPYTPLANIHLLYRPGHYDLLYPLSNSDEPLPLLIEETSKPPDTPLTHPIDPPSATTRLVSVACLYPSLLKHHGFIHLRDTVHEVLDADYVVVGTGSSVESSPLRVPTSIHHPFLQSTSFSVQKSSSDENLVAPLPTLLEQTLHQTRVFFQIPTNRQIKLFPAIEYSLDYLFDDRWIESRAGYQMIAMVEHISLCRISIIGMTKFNPASPPNDSVGGKEGACWLYRPIKRFIEMKSYLELETVVDWNQFETLTNNSLTPTQLTTSSAASLLKLISNSINLNESLFALQLNHGLISLSPNITCELCVIIRIEICGTNEQKTLPIPISKFGSFHDFASILRQEFNLKPLTCLQLRIPLSSPSSHSSFSSSKVVWEADEVFNYCLETSTRGSLSETPLFSLRFCEVSEEGTACETISGYSDHEATSAGSTGNLICRISSCGHHVCQLCLLRHLVVFSNDRKKKN
jgi:hypothetical protein